jgi:flagellar protein FlaJ
MSHKYFLQAGFNSITEYFIKVVLPLLVLTLALFYALIIFRPINLIFAYLVLFMGVMSIVAIPVILRERKRVKIDENIPMFITYSGTISTIDLDRKTFFTKVAENTDFGLISYYAGKIVYLAKSWNLGFANSLRRVALFTPSTILSDFYDRFAAALDFGEPLDIFLLDEQKSVMDDYATMYRKALNNIGMLREAFIAITISLAFGMSTALLLPLLMGISMLFAIKVALGIIFFIDLILLVFISAFIPSDNLCHNLKTKDKTTEKIYFWFYILFPISAILFVLLTYLHKLNFLFNVGIALLPLLYIGYLASNHENLLYKRDKEFPSFIRTLGATIFARQGGVMTSLEALLIHNFGSLQEIVENLYKRLKIGSDKMKSWYFFAAESGSKLIASFTNIFAQSIYLGGHARKIGEIISENFQKFLSLRKLRYQQASALRSALYGSLVGFIVTVYISISISDILTKMFSKAWDNEAAGSSITSMISSAIPHVASVPMSVVNVYVGLIILIHAFISAMIIKIVDGGDKFAVFFDFSLMVWIGALLSWLVPMFSNRLFAGMIGG